MTVSKNGVRIGRPKNGQGKSLDGRAAEMRARLEAKKVEIPAQYADNNVRRARVLFIRKRMGLTQVQFAREIGLSLSYYLRIESGRQSCTMMCLKFSEVLLQFYLNRERRILAGRTTHTKLEDIQTPSDPQL